MPSTGFVRFNTVDSVSGVTTSSAATLLSLGAGGSSKGEADVSDVGDTITLKGITHSVPSDATVVGIEMRIAVRTNTSGSISFQLAPRRIGTTSSTGNTTTVSTSNPSGGVYHLTAGGSTTTLGLTMSGSDVDDIAMRIRTSANASSVGLRLSGQETTGSELIAPSINVYYDLPPGGTIEKWNSIPINSAAAGAGTTSVVTSSTTLGTFDFEGQVRQTSTSHSDTGGWTPSDPNVVGQLNMSGWANGADASAAFNWKTSSNNDTPSIRASQEAADWFMGPNSTSGDRATASTGTGPPAGLDPDNIPSSLDSSSSVGTDTRFIFSETTGSDGRNHVKVCRTLGINFSTAMSNTSNDLNLCFYIHAHGATCGGLSVYIDDASTSGDSQATLLKNLECRTVTSPSNPTTKVREYTSGGKTTGATSLGEHVFTNYDDGSSSGLAQDWAKITISLNSYRTVDDSYYIYFAYSANSGSGTTHNTDRLEAGETAAASSGFRGDFAIDHIFLEEVESGPFGKTLNLEGTNATNITEVNISTVPS